MRRRIVRAVAVAVLCASTVAGCSVMAAVPKRTAAPPASSATAAPAATTCQTNDNLISACKRLGDFSTLDPCSLISVGQLPPDLAASPMPRDSLDDCGFHITAGPDKDSVLEVGQLDSDEDSNGARYDAGSQDLQPAGLELEQGTLSQGGCNDALYFGGDEVNLDIDVFVVRGDGSQALCDAANEVGKVLGTVIASNVQVQHFTVGKNSLAAVKACGLLDGSEIAGNSVDGQPETPSGHSCVWQPDVTKPDLEYGVNLEIGDALAKETADSHTQIHGLDTYTLKYNASGYTRCEVDTYRLPWGNTNGDLHEIASVWAIEAVGQVDAACSAATQMAGIVWPKLPPLS